MTPLFQTKKNNKTAGEKTILLLDVENGSVGSALVRLHPNKQPKLFGEMRARTPLPDRVTGRLLSVQIEKAARAAITNASEVASRVRAHPQASALGEVSAIAVFLAAPWGTPNLTDGQPAYIPEMSDYLRGELKNLFDNTPVSLHTNAGVAAFGTQALFAPEPCLVCSVTSEVSELMRMDGMGVQAHATIPTGTHALLRTLRAHGSMTEEEARSMLKLPLDADHPAHEASRAAALEFSTHFKDAAKDLLSPGDVLRVRVLGHEPVGEWFARALTLDDSIAELFPDGGEVRAMRANHLTPHIEAHAEVPDLLLLLEALFVDSRFNR